MPNPKTGPTFADIAAELQRIAATLPNIPPKFNPMIYQRDAYRIGPMVIRCQPYRECVLSVAAKYAKPWSGAVRGGAGPLLRNWRPSMARPQDADAQLAALELEHAGA